MDNLLPRLKVIGGAVVALLAVIIVLQNTEVVETKLLFTTIAMPRAALLIGTLVIGYLLGVLTSGRLLGRKKSGA